MPLDPQIERILQGSPGWAAASSVPVDQLRAAAKGFAAVTPKLDVPLREVSDRSISGPVLNEAGAPVERDGYAGMSHGFMSWLGLVDMAQTPTDDARPWLRKQFEAAR